MGQSGNAIIVTISIVFSVVAITAVALRFRARQVKKMRLGADDYLILPATMFAAGMGVTNTIGAIRGNLGGHTKLGPNGIPVFDRKIPVFLQCEFAVQLLSIGALTFTKLSLLSLYRRIFRGRTFNRVAWVLSGMAVVWGISFFFATLFECYPIHEVWTTFYGQPRHCYVYLPMFYATAVTNMVTDLCILTIPLPMIWKLQMPTQQKIAVSGMFLLGALVCGISVARLYFFVQAAAGFDNAYDVTYNLAPTLYWTQLEGALAVVSACLPTLRPIFGGLSPERLISILRSGTFRPFFRSKNSVDSSFTQRDPSNSDYQSSLSGLNRNNNDTVFESNIESIQMRDLDTSRDDARNGIMVQKKVDIQRENVSVT